ncbi:hypothetical protein [Salinarimonas soli]|uniref:Uncharacterized protein n=1 Tax=Salinarimonas soli TaxID=1638099 RepID=A0A5B2VS34_9HYPH|nr:hypothetical protein [Salinarimonas soli]KAA2241156.1 hypothetical protein F0L46_04990 [Salinarimonas soli]
MALEGGVPALYARAFAVLQVVQPAGVDLDHWHRAINDAGLLLDARGDEAERLGWPDADVIALAWALNGASVSTLTTTTARLSDGRTIERGRS